MGTVIAAAATARPSRRPTSHGARRLADEAARLALLQAQRVPDDVDVLVNAGVYRERGLGEPALAALIQEDIDAGLGRPPTGGRGTFSFDIDNGAVGVLTGVHLVRGLLESGTAELGLVLASDSASGPLSARRMPDTEAGGALLLGRDDAVPGFVRLHFTTFPEYAELCEGCYEWRPGRRLRPHGPGGRNRLVVLERPGFRERTVDCAERVAARFLADAGLHADGVDLLVATGGPGFADALADRLGLPHTRVVHLPEDLAQVHTAEPVAAVATAVRTGAWDVARTVLFVAAGAGITVGTALYRH